MEYQIQIGGKFLVHASKSIDREACKRLDIDIDNLRKGVIIGSAFLYDVKQYINKKNLSKINKSIFLLLVNILMDTNTVSSLKIPEYLKNQFPIQVNLDFLKQR